VPVHEAAREPGHRKPASAPGSRTAARSADARTRPGKAALHEAWPESSRPKPRLNLDSM
jgi:hypothetical protein